MGFHSRITLSSEKAIEVPVEGTAAWLGGLSLCQSRMVEYLTMAETLTPYATPETIEEESTDAGDGLEARVVVYNCNCHTYQQVIQLFCEAIPGMNPKKAFDLAWKIDHHGSAAVYMGDPKTAEGIAKHLAAGGLKVAVQ